jgi:hypothetical protein
VHFVHHSTAASVSFHVMFTQIAPLRRTRTHTDRYGFSFCTSLTNVVISDSVTSIGDYAFVGCSMLPFVFLPDSVTSIQPRSFTSCLGFGLELITNNSPRGRVECIPCNQSSLDIPDTVTAIGDFAFYQCTSLTSVVIPNSVETIGDLSFYSSINLASIVIPDSITSIGFSAFENCACVESAYTAGANLCDCNACTTSPTEAPTNVPTFSPTFIPTSAPTDTPTIAPSHAPTLPPTASPTEAPTASPTVASTVGCSAFEPIAGLGGATNLTSLSVDDAILDIILPFTFSWLGEYNVTVVRVSTNGFINVDKDSQPSADSSYCSAAATCPLIAAGSGTFARIAVMHEDLNPGVRGGIYTRYVASPESFVISWEDVPFYFGVGSANAQAVLYPTGAIELRWGANAGGSSDGAVAGVADPTVTPEVAMPASVTPFGVGGATPVGSFPNNVCQQFLFSAIACQALPPVLLQGAATASNSGSYPSTATYTCDPGYEVVGSATRFCQLDGSWSGTAPQCVPRTCELAPAVLNGYRAVTNGGFYPSTVSYSCNPGFMLVGSPTRDCLPTGQWDGSAPECIVTTAPTATPTTASTPLPTTAPTASPSASPTDVPSFAPTATPTRAPSTASPTAAPTNTPSYAPSPAPTSTPTVVPTPAPTMLPTTAPTSPTGAPTNAPTAAPWALTSCSDFVPIAGLVDTTDLTVLRTDEGLSDVTLPFGFMWLGEYNVTVVRVASNGFIHVDKNNQPNNYIYSGNCEISWCPRINLAPWPYQDSFPLVSRIAVMHEDLNPGVSGGIYTRYIASPESFVISWEGVPFYYDLPGVSSINAQAVLYPSGAVELRWGANSGGSSRGAVAGVADPTVNPQVAMPATVTPFANGGATPEGSFPNNVCQLFVYVAPPPTAPTSVPTSAPTRAPTSPTAAPTTTPSGTPTVAPSAAPTAPTSAPTDAPTRTPTSPTAAPTTTPSGIPTSTPSATPTAPTTAPTYGIDCSAFEPVAGLTDTTNVTALSADEGTLDITLPFEFSWLGEYNVTVVRVSTNGFINVDIDNQPDATSTYCLDPWCPRIEIGGQWASWTEYDYTDDYYFTNTSFSRIAVLHSDFNPSLAGGIYTRYVASPESFVISWEGVPFFFNSSSGVGAVYAQAVLYPDGAVELRWGAIDGGGSTNGAVAGVADPTVTPEVAMPATVTPFGVGGAAPVGSFPSNVCQLFVYVAPPPTASTTTTTTTTTTMT